MWKGPQFIPEPHLDIIATEPLGDKPADEEPSDSPIDKGKIV